MNVSGSVGRVQWADRVTSRDSLSHTPTAFGSFPGPPLERVSRSRDLTQH